MAIGAMMAGGNPAAGRQDADFYPTPENVTTALLNEWRPAARSVWEPACGDGAISKPLAAAGYHVISTDLVDRGYVHGVGGVDFLATDKLLSDCIITNPPFNLAAKFIEHAFDLGVMEMALVLKSTYWHASSRAALFNKYKPTYIMPLLWRPDFLNKGAPTMEVMWCVWDERTSLSGTRYVPLTRPN